MSMYSVYYLAVRNKTTMIWGYNFLKECNWWDFKKSHTSTSGIFEDNFNTTTLYKKKVVLCCDANTKLLFCYDKEKMW